MAGATQQSSNAVDFATWTTPLAGLVWRTVRRVAPALPTWPLEDLRQEALVAVWRVYKRHAARSTPRQASGLVRMALHNRFQTIRRNAYRPHRRASVELLGYADVAVPDPVDPVAEVEMRIMLEQIDRMLQGINGGRGAAALRVLLHPGVELLQWVQAQSHYGRSLVELQRAMIAHATGWPRAVAGAALTEALVAVVKELKVPNGSSLPLIRIQALAQCHTLQRRQRMAETDPFLDAMSGEATDAPKKSRRQQRKEAKAAAEAAAAKPKAKGKGKAVAAAAAAPAKGKKARAAKANGATAPSTRTNEAARVTRGQKAPREGTARRAIYDAVPPKGVSLGTLVEKVLADKKTQSPRGGVVNSGRIRRRFFKMSNEGCLSIAD